jgi:hypothetical protein
VRDSVCACKNEKLDALSTYPHTPHMQYFAESPYTQKRPSSVQPRCVLGQDGTHNCTLKSCCLELCCLDLWQQQSLLAPLIMFETPFGAAKQDSPTGMRTRQAVMWAHDATCYTGQVMQTQQ